MPDAPRLVEARDGAVLTLTLDYPARRNALALPLRAALVAALDAAIADRGVRAIVLTGAAGHFCAGGDITGMAVEDWLAGRERMRRTHAIVRLLAMGPLPVVAAVEGVCVGAGLSLACCCDTIVASATARFAAGFGRIGLIADCGLPHTLPARIGHGRARQLLFFHHQLDAAEAERIGLVDAVVPAGEALAAATDRARCLAAQAPGPIAATKQLLAAGLETALAAEVEHQAALFRTADFAEGRAAFLAKRTPEFRGD